LAGADDTSHDGDIAALAALADRNAVDEEGLFYLALARIRRARELQLGGKKEEEAEKLLADIEQRATRAAESPQAGAGTLFRAAQAFAMLAREAEGKEQATARVIGPLETPSSVVATQPTLPASARRSLQRARQTIARARGLSGPDHRRFLEIRLLEGELAAADGDLVAAERLYRELLNQLPGSLAARLPLTRVLGPTRAEEGVQLLADLRDPSAAVPGPGVLQRGDLLAQAVLQKASLSLDACANMEEPSILAARIERARLACEQAREAVGELPVTLKLVTRLHVLQGRFLEAINTSNRAGDLSAKANGPRDPELLYFKAMAFRALHELGEARAALQQALDLNSGLAEHRLLLAQVLVERGEFTAAAEQAQILALLLKDDPRVTYLWLAVLRGQDAAQPDPQRSEQIKGYYARLPETDRTQKMSKARAASDLGDWKEEVRLLREVLAADPASPGVAAALVRALALGNQNEQANKVLADALQRNPTHAELLYLKKKMEGATPEELERYAQSLTENSSDAFGKALSSARAALRRMDAVDARKSLDQARALKSDDPALMDLLFRCALLEKRWEQADALGKKLAASNFDQMSGLSYRLQLAQAHGDSAAALAAAREMTERYAEYAGSWTALGEALMASGRFEQALVPFTTALSLDTGNVPALKGAAASGLALGQTREAAQWIARGRKIAPDDAELRELELRKELLTGDPRRLIAPQQEAMRRETSRPDNAVALARVYLQIASPATAASPEEARGALEHAAQILDQAIKQWPDEQACYSWAVAVADRRGDRDTAERILKELAARDAWRRRPEPWLALADHQLNGGHLDQAEAALHEAIQRGAGSNVAVKLARVLATEGKWDAALEAMSPYSSERDAQLQKLWTLLGAQRSAQAEAEAKAAVDGDPKSAYRMALLALVYASRHEDKQALSWLDRAVAANPSEVLAVRLRGEIGLRRPMVNLEKVIDDLSTAHELSPGDIEAALLLADAYGRKRDFSNAQAVLQQAVRAAFSDKRPRLRLIALQGSIAAPDWDSVARLIGEGRTLWPTDAGWDAAEARMWYARGDAAKAAATMRRAVAIAQAPADTSATRPAVSAAQNGAAEGESGAAVRGLIREELAMLLAAKDGAAVLREADLILSRYGAADMASAWAHLARGMALHRANPADGAAATEFDAALASAEAAGDCAGAIEIVGGIAVEAGPAEALRQITGHGGGATGGTGPAAAVIADPRWDVLRADLLMQTGDAPAATAIVDAMMPQIGKLPPDYQVTLLRLAADLYGRGPAASQIDKSRRAYMELIERLPEDLWSLNNLAYLFLEQVKPAQPREALTYSRRAYEAMKRANAIDPGNADTYGWALVMSGHADEAIGVLKDVVQRLPLPETHYHLGEAYLAASMPVEAQVQLDAALDLLQLAEKGGRPVVPTLRARIEAARQRAADDATAKKLTPAKP
jgi:tetratricopeptide (TPR) repeat protein